MIDQLKDLKDTFDVVKSQIDKGKEPLEDLLKLQAFLQAVLADTQGFFDKIDKDYKRYFLDDFTMGMLKRLSRERSKDDKYLDVISGILETYMLLFIETLKLGLFNQQFFDSIKFMFEYDSILHNYNFQIPEEQLKMLRSANQEWRKELKTGDMVDAIVDELNVRASGWSQARISSVNGDILQLEFLFDTKNVDRFLDRWSVEIAQYETKTKELWEYKATLKIGDTIDANDKSTWNQSTILDIKEQHFGPDRTVKMAFIGYRVYNEAGKKSDEKGNFDGWSTKFDEWLAIYSPRIMPFYSKTQKGVQDDMDLDEDLDNLLQPEEGFTKVYAVPRIRKCISSVFMHLINLFGNKGGFDICLELIRKAAEPLPEGAEEPKEGEAFDLNMLGTLIQILSYSYLVYHKEFIQEYGPKFVEVCIKALRDAPEKSLRNVRREKIESIIKSIDNFQRRLITKDEREKQTEVLKLEVSLMCLRSSYMERRIHGIRELTAIIKNMRMFSTNKTFTPMFLIQWMDENGVFSQLFDPKKTHLQLVQRTSDVLKLLLSENMLSQQLIEQFWSLTKADYKFEIYKIINEISFYLKQEHIDYFFEQIRQIPSEKLAIEEFQCLSELGKYAKDDQFKVQVSSFFWEIICNSENIKEELVTSCTTKFCEMVKYWDMAKKHQFFTLLTKNLSENKSAISSIRLFKGLIKDQKDRTSYNYNSSPLKYAQSSSIGGQQAQEMTQELTLAQSLTTLIMEQNLARVIIDSLSHYYGQARSKVTAQTASEPRKKIFLVNPKYSHHDEVDERLQFLKYLASTAIDFSISKADLGAIYALVYQNPLIPSDPEEFLTWCKSSCEQSTTYSQILDLNEVGQFFTEKMTSGELEVKTLLVVGFDFLQQYFLSVNENQQSIIKVQPKVQPKSKFNNGYNYSSITYGYNAAGQYGPKYNYLQGANKNQEEATSQQFKLIKPPSDLTQLDIMWDIALQCQNDSVVPKAIDFLIKIYYSLDADLDEQRLEIQDQLIDKCMHILRGSQDSHQIQRVIEIIKSIIKETEKKGTGDVKPHNALLKGELLENIVIKYRAQAKTKTCVMRIYSNATVWEFKKEVSRQFELAPKYLRLEMGNNRVVKDTENGKTLAQLGLKSNEQLTATKIFVEEEIPNAPLIGSDGHLSEKAKAIFNEWFDMYSNENGQMTKETCGQFIKGCTGETPPPNDDRIITLFKTYDTNNDGFIERQEFLTFYESSCRQKPDTVRENLRSHNIRNDLKKLSEVTEDSSFKTEDMPRFKISKNQDQFDLLISLLDRSDSASQASWDLIQMLATNQDLYKRVLQLKTAQDASTGKIEWSKFFDSQSVYKLLYTLQIVEAVMEEGEGEGLESVEIIDEIADNKKKNIPNAPPMVGPLPPNVNQADIEVDKTEDTEDKQAEPAQQQQNLQVAKSKAVVADAEDRQLKSQWTKMFLENQGFHYILNEFMSKEIKGIESVSQLSNNLQFELKHIAFLLKLLRIFIMAAFSTSAESSSIYESSVLIRRSSNVTEEPPELALAKQSSTRFAELQKQMEGPIGEEIISQINYKELQQRILKLIKQILDARKDSDDMTFEEKLIIENALSLWVGCILHKQELLNDFYAFDSDEFILSGLLYCNQDKIREEFNQSLSQLSLKLQVSKSVKEIPLTYLLRLLSSKFHLISQYHCKQYFELFCQLIDQYFTFNKSESSVSDDVFNPETLLALIIDKIKEYNQLATKLSSNSGDASAQSVQVQEIEEIYVGLIQLTGKIIDNFDISFSEKIVEQKSLIDEIFVNFLFKSAFSQESQNGLDNLRIKPKKKNSGDDDKKSVFGKRSKDSAYKLLNSLIRKSPLLMNSFLEKSLLPLINLVKRQEKWNYSPPGQIEKASKYVGLYNPACICYMNSMLQQFFMIPPLRYNLLCVEDNIPEDLQDHRGAKIDDNVLHQLQKLMANLELSPRQDYNPTEFCFAFKDFEGNPTNLGEQKDAQEFLNLAFDRLENLLRPTCMKYLLQSIFCGQTCNQFVCNECGTVKNRIEDFYNLSLTVKDIKSMYESLQKLIEGEIISDYMCDTCKKKVDISKRILLSKAPNVLIVHLQRIVFNFETFRNDKLNSFFDFPYQLDLKPYSFYDVMSKEGRLKKPAGEDGEEEQPPAKTEENTEENPWPEEEECYEYKLVGVEVHSGSANAGHYWSFINTRRGVDEPNEQDPNWNKTESDPWMKFNDSTVSEYNFEKLKEDCFGGDGKSGDGDSWSFGGTYGQSAYMLVYEKRLKRPLKILATPEEIQVKKDSLLFDEKKEEHYKLIDYREIVEDVPPNSIYKKVYEDNFKLDFENDIYSAEFFEFIRQITLAVQALDSDRKHQGQQPELLEKAKKNMLAVSKKTILDLLAKCYQNTSIKHLVEALTELMNRDASLASQFLDQCFQEDGCAYLLEIMLEATDAVARNHVASLLKFVINKLKVAEKDVLYDVQRVQHEVNGEKVEFDQHVALSARFISKALNLLNTQVAKNWSRFDHFLEVIETFALGLTDPKTGNQIQQNIEDSEIGLEFLFRVSFIEKACDFILGKKSPLLQSGEKRYEMGGSFTQANFGPFIRIVTRMIQHETLLAKYPLTDTEKKMFLHQDFLKVMLSLGASAKQFGQCLANMCRDTYPLSRKVSKVFIKAINGSNADNLKAYLKALKPFLRMNDQFKEVKLEWIFGFCQVVTRKNYKEERYRYGLELVDRINEDAHTYITPLASSSNEESLLSQLLKCKGRQDTNCILCLQEMLHLMAKDDVIARFVYNTPAHTYQCARFTDWFRSYLNTQRQETEKSITYNNYFKSKFESILKSLIYLERVEAKFRVFAEEDKAAYERAVAEEGQEFEEIQKDYLSYKNPDVIESFPPQIIIGKQVGEDVEFLVYDEDPNVKVTIYEVQNEYNYSNPTGLFNISLPHIEAKTTMYQTMSYVQYKRAVQENERRDKEQKEREQSQAQNTPQSDQEDGIQVEDSTQATQSEGEAVQMSDPQEDAVRPLKEEEFQVINWFSNHKVEPLLLKVIVTNKERQKISCRVKLVGDESTNALLPKSDLKLQFFDNETRLLVHVMKKDPTKPWGTIMVQVTSSQDSSNQFAERKEKIITPTINIGNTGVSIGLGLDFGGSTTDKKVGCLGCGFMNDFGMDYCDKCGESLNDPAIYEDAGIQTSSFIENYYAGSSGGNSGANEMA